MDENKIFLLDRGELEGRFDALFNSIKHNKFTSVFPSKPLYQICKSLSGGTPNKSVQSYWSNGTIPWVSPKDFKTLYMYGEEDFITEKALQDSSTKLVPENTILIVFRSGVLQHTFPVAIATREMAINQDLKALIFNEEVLPYYALYYFNTFGNSLLPLITKHSTTVQSINTEQFSRLAFPIPPKDIQQTIICIMDVAYETKKTKETEAKELLDSIDDYLLGELGITLPPESANTLDERTFEVGFAEIFCGRFDSKSYLIKSPLKTQKYPLVKLKTTADINPLTSFVHFEEDDEISFLPMEKISDIFGEAEAGISKRACESKGYTRFQENDLLWSKITPCMENGKSAVVQNLVKGYGFGSTEFHVFRARENLDIVYLHSLLRLKCLRDYAKLFFTGSAGHQRVDAEFFRTLEIPLPPFDTQNRIAEEIKRRRDKAKKLQTEAKEVLEKAKKDVEKIILGNTK